MKAYLLSILLFGIAAMLTLYSHAEMMFMIGAALIMIALSGSALVTVWMAGSWGMRFEKACKWVFPTTAALYLLGYFWETWRIMA